ncbi:MAG: hypothetical protein AAFP90_17065, partial [Planctomycetota bacterium]
MNEIQTPVNQAARRVWMQRFVQSLSWWLFAGLMVAAFAIAAQAIWVIPVDQQTWALSWVTGGVSTALIGAVILTSLTQPTMQSVATEVDRRFGLKERISSSLALSAAERETAAGQALVRDAAKRADKIDVREHFGVQPERSGLLMLIPIAMVGLFLIVLTPAKEAEAKVEKSETMTKEMEQAKRATKKLLKKLEQKRRQAEAEGLDENVEMYKKLEAKLRKDIEKSEITKKDALITMNDIRKQLSRRRDQLGNNDRLKNALRQMKNVEDGPAGEIAKAMQKGEFGKAQNKMQQLMKKLQKGELTKQEKNMLNKQLDQMQKQMQKAADKQKAAEQSLKDQIKQAQQQGDKKKASQLQQKLDQMQRNQSNADAMQKMAEAMKKAQQAMQEGDKDGAAQAMKEMADQMGEMQANESQLQELEDAMNELGDSKGQMKGMGPMGNQNRPRNGMGEGQGEGDRAEEEDQTGTYKSQVKGDTQRGVAVISGTASGPNRKGVTRAQIRDSFQQPTAEQSDPLEDQLLPRA